MITATIGTCNGCGVSVELPCGSPWDPGVQVVVIPADQFAEYYHCVGVVLGHLCNLDPTGGAERHPEWPLRLCAAEDVVESFCENLNSLETMHNNLKDLQ